MSMRFWTSCASAAVLLGAGAAYGQDFKVTISGDAEFQAVAGSQKRNSGSRDVDFRNRFRLIVNPEATGLNGALTYGGAVRILAANGDGTAGYDRAYTYVKGSFGTLIGGLHTTYNDDVGAATAPNDWRTQSAAALSFVNASARYSGTDTRKLAAWRWDTLSPTGNNTRLRYQTPFISGFQVGASFTPAAGNLRDQGTNSGWSFNRGKSGITDSYEVGLLFDSTDKSIADRFGPMSLKASVNYQGGTIRDTANVKREDLSAFQAGLAVGYGGFTVGGGAVYYGKSGLAKTDPKKVDAYTWRVGAQYQWGAWTTGVGYDYSQKDVDFDTLGATAGFGKKQAEQFGAGVRYTVAKGFDVAAEYDHVKTRNTLSGRKDNADVVILSTKLSF